ncbi:MAG: pilus assembly protein PilP [Deltaproteobacteria bacterium]|nr:pilus assembly protein PilP [Deltaproteobacteria bacterium]
MSKLGIMFLIGCFLVMGFGCGDEAPKPKKVPISPAAPKPAATPAPAKVPPKPEAEVKVEPPRAVSYSYNPQGKPNPFQPLVVERPEKSATPAAKKVEGAKREREGAGTPLERMELAELKLVAVVWDIPKPRAMVEDKGGKGYILTVGTRIGKNQGQVSKITPEGLVVSEKTEAPDGKIKTREVPLRLYSDQ